jgi:hypothetical protein
MTETLPRLLLRLSEAGEPALLWGRLAAPYAGRSFERLLEHGVLVEEAPAREWDVCPACDCGLEVRMIQQVNGQNLAACPMDRRRDLVLDEDDLRSFRIDPAALVREIAADSGFTTEASPIATGLWHLGETSSQRALFLALSRDAVLQPGMIGLMRSVGRSLPITVIAPAMAADELILCSEAIIAAVSMDACLGSKPTGFAIDLSSLEPVPVFEPHLVILRRCQRVILGGVDVQVPQQPFNLLVKLAEAIGGPVGHLTPHQIEAENSGRVASDLVRELRGHLQHPQNKLIETRRSPTRYRLALAPEEFDLRP